MRFGGWKKWVAKKIDPHKLTRFRLPQAAFFHYPHKKINKIFSLSFSTHSHFFIHKLSTFKKHRQREEIKEEAVKYKIKKTFSFSARWHTGNFRQPTTEAKKERIFIYKKKLFYVSLLCLLLLLFCFFVGGVFAYFLSLIANAFFSLAAAACCLDIHTTEVAFGVLFFLLFLLADGCCAVFCIESTCVCCEIEREKDFFYVRENGGFFEGNWHWIFLGLKVDKKKNFFEKLLLVRRIHFNKKYFRKFFEVFKEIFLHFLQDFLFLKRFCNFLKIFFILKMFFNHF